ncbi:MAG: LytTR family DNA-binding domain-containing protein [Bacteroidota bacterium]|nr:LytTR family DNA-binding domain-containing protein [Bacteroidota bacterium]
MLRTLLIDDEPAARQRLNLLLKPYSDFIKIVGEAENGPDAIRKIDLIQPDLVFLDIQMPIHNGLEVMQKVAHLPMVIFCTAFDKYALDAFNTFSIDYLLKPVSAERMTITINKLKRIEQRISPTDIDTLLKQIQPQTSKKKINTLPVKHGDRIILVSVNEISYLSSSDKYVTICTHSGKKHLIEHTLKDLEEILPEQFLRIHKSHIINIHSIEELQRYFGGRFVFILNDVHRSHITSGRNFSENIKSYFGL